jgi:hypothetical protein
MINKLKVDGRLVLKKCAVRGTRHVMKLNFLRMTTRPGKVFKYVVGPLIGEIKYYNLQSVRRDPLSTTYGGRSELGSRNLGNNDETGESIQVWTGQRRNKVLQSVNPDPPHVREKSELGSRNRVHRDNNQVITGHRGQMLQYYEKGIVLGEVIQFTEEI